MLRILRIKGRHDVDCLLDFATLARWLGLFALSIASGVNVEDGSARRTRPPSRRVRHAWKSGGRGGSGPHKCAIMLPSPDHSRLALAVAPPLPGCGRRR